MITFTDLFKNEGTVAADIAQATTPFSSIQKKKTPKSPTGEKVNTCKHKNTNDTLDKIMDCTSQKDLYEARPTRISNILLEISKNKNVQLLDMHGTIDGFVALIRYKDGNAYEVRIKPAEKSTEFPHLT
jgi:hypothetical protein